MSSFHWNSLPHSRIPANGSPQIQQNPAGTSFIASAVPTGRTHLPVLPAHAIPMSPTALVNNQKLFPIFQSHLSDPTLNGNYAPSAERFTEWLSKDKAYYTAARGWIVTLLEQAKETICMLGKAFLPRDRPFHISQCPPGFEYWVVPYVKLIRMVKSFEHMFIEHELRSRLQILFSSIEQPQTHLHTLPPHARQPQPVTGSPSSATPPPNAVPQRSASTSSLPTPSAESSPLPPTPNTQAVNAPIKKKSKTKSSSLLSKGFLDADVEWFQQRQKEKPKDGDVDSTTATSQPQLDYPVPQTTLNGGVKSHAGAAEEPIVEPNVITSESPEDNVTEDVDANTSVTVEPPGNVALNAQEENTRPASDHSVNPDAVTNPPPNLVLDASSATDTIVPEGLEAVDSTHDQNAMTADEKHSRSKSLYSGPTVLPDVFHPVASTLRSYTPPKSATETRELDLSKISPKPKLKRTSPDFAFTRVTHSPETIPKVGSSSPPPTSLVSEPPLASFAETLATASAQPPGTAEKQSSSTSRKPKTKRKGPPGIRATEFQPHSPAEPRPPTPPPKSPESPRLVIKIPGRKGPPGVKVLPSLNNDAVSSIVPQDTPTSQAQIPEEHRAPSPSRSGGILSATSEPAGPPTFVRGSSKDVLQQSRVELHETSQAHDAEVTDGPLHPSSDTVDQYGHGRESAPPPNEMDVDGVLSEEEEPLATRHRRVTLKDLKRVRSRSPSIPLANQRRKVTPVSTSSANKSLAVRSAPREYSAAAFESGDYVYSPVQPAFEPARLPQSTSAKPSDPLPQKRREGLPKTTGLAAPAAPHKGKISWESVGVVIPTEEELVATPVFAQDSAVLGSARGYAFPDWHPIEFEFDLDEKTFEALTLWNTRFGHKQDLAHARCLSLACYKHPEHADTLSSSPQDPTIDSTLSCRPIAWPNRPPIVEINHGQTGDVRFAISHWHWDSDYVVDISKRIKPGRNMIKLTPRMFPSSAADYLFVLRLHSPTPRQNTEVMKRRGSDKAWHDVLARCSQIIVPELECANINLDPL